ncbi:hypothetical protein ACUXCC_005023 [Cytobacillus horneckiae]
MKIILDYGNLIEDDSYSQLINERCCCKMAALFVIGTVAVYGVVMKHVLNNVTKPQAR